MSVKFVTCTLFRLKTSDSAKNKQIDSFLKYDFSKDKDEYTGFPVSLSKYYWRNIFNTDVSSNDNKNDYYNFYNKELTDIASKIEKTPFILDIIDMSTYLLSYSLSLQLGSFTDGITLEFKESEVILYENDLIEISEMDVDGNSEVIFLGFVTTVSPMLSYENFYTQKVGVLNIGKIYSISKISDVPSLADISVKGQDMKILDVPVFSNIFNNLNTYKIIDKLLTNFFMAMISQQKSSDIDTQYVIDNTLFANPNTFTQANYVPNTKYKGLFNVMYLILLTLSLYEQANKSGY